MLLSFSRGWLQCCESRAASLGRWCPCPPIMEPDYVDCGCRQKMLQMRPSQTDVAAGTEAATSNRLLMRAFDAGPGGVLGPLFTGLGQVPFVTHPIHIALGAVARLRIVR